MTYMYNLEADGNISIRYFSCTYPHSSGQI